MRALFIKVKCRSGVLQHLIKSWHILKWLKYIMYEKYSIFSLSNSPISFKPTTCSASLTAEFCQQLLPNLSQNVERQKKPKSRTVALHTNPNLDHNPRPPAKTPAPRPTKLNRQSPRLDSTVERERSGKGKRDRTKEREIRRSPSFGVT
jgi:hypothetical protein